MKTNTNPGFVKYQARCSCGMRGHKHVTETIARLSMVAHISHAELAYFAKVGQVAQYASTTGHHITVVAVFG